MLLYIVKASLSSIFAYMIWKVPTREDYTTDCSNCMKIILLMLPSFSSSRHLVDSKSICPFVPHLLTTIRRRGPLHGT